MRDISVPSAKLAASRWMKLWKMVAVSRSTAEWQFAGKELFALAQLGYIGTGTYRSDIVYLTEVGKAAAAEMKVQS